jgi:autotransporter-associated beta strand protein
MTIGSLGNNNTGAYTLTLAGSGTGGYKFSSAISNGSATNTTTVVVDYTSGTVQLRGGTTGNFSGGLRIKQGGQVIVGQTDMLGLGIVTMGYGGGSSAVSIMNDASAKSYSAPIFLESTHSGTATIGSTSGQGTFTGGVTGTHDLIVDSVVTGTGLLTFTTIGLNYTGNLTKNGAGTLSLGATNTYTGSTTVTAGTLILDYTTADNTTKLSDTAGLTLGSATLQLDRSTTPSGSHTEIVLSTTLDGAARVTRGAGSSAVLQMNPITRNAGGSLNLGAASIASTDTNNTTGILGPWATINSTDWATSVDSGAADTPITAYTGYIDVQRFAPGTIADGSTTNVRLIAGSGPGGNITLGATTTTINTLNQSNIGGGDAGIINTASKTLAVNGILLGSGTGFLTIGTTAGSGTLQTATSGGELMINQYSSNLLTINSVIANNTSASSLTHTGTGITVLAGTNTYTGKTIITRGKISIAAETGLGDNPGSLTADQLTLNGGTLLTTATLAIDDANRGITLGRAGGTFEVSTGTTTVASTNIIAGNGSLTKTGNGTLTLSAANTYTGATTVSAGTLELGVDDCLANTSNVAIGAGTLKAAANVNDTVGTLDPTAAATIDLASGATLAFTASNAVNWTGGTLNLTGTLDFSGTSTSSLRFGTDTNGLTAAQLLLISATGWSGFGLNASGYLTATPTGGPGPLDNFLISAISSPQTVGTPITGITLTARDASNATVTSFTGTVNFGGTGGFTGTSANFVAGVLSGVSVTPTVAGSGLTFTVTDIGSGKTGSTTVTTIQTQYQFWAGGALFDADTNGDGVQNGLAFLLGAADKNVSALSLLPTVTQSSGNLILNFKCLNAAKRGSAVLKVQYSKDLGITDLWNSHLGDSAVVPGTAPTSVTVGGVDFVSSVFDADKNNMQATIPASAASPGTKLFGRLKAEQN